MQIVKEPTSVDGGRDTSRKRASAVPQKTPSWSTHVSECLPRDPLPKKRIDDDVAIPFTRHHIVAHQRSERGLNRGRSAKPMTRTDVSREQFPAVLEHDRTKRSALRQRETLPHGFEQHLLFRQQPFQRLMQIVKGHTPSGAAPDFVPGFVRETLHVVG
jgi:hypothetical protein